MNEEIYVSDTSNRPSAARMRRVSWGAIVAGLFVTIVAQVTLTLLGVAVGMATVNPLNERNPAEGLAMGAGIWFVVSALISLFAGAYVAGRLSGGPRRVDGLLHGIVMWSVAEVAMLALLTTSVGALIGGGANLMSQVVQNQQAQGRNPLEQAGQQFQDLVSQDQDKNLAPTGQASGRPGAPAVNEQEMRETGQKAASGVATAALIAFLGMVLGLGVAAWGGWIGTASLPRYREAVVTERVA